MAAPKPGEPGYNALKQKRYRQHAKGDHSLCLASGCDVAYREAHRPLEGLGKAGKALWKGATQFEELTATQRAILLSACRVADRLELLQEAMNDPEQLKWAMREARQQEAVQKGLITELRLSGASGGSGGDDPPEGNAPPGNEPSGEEKTTNVSDLTARIAEKRAGFTGEHSPTSD